MTKQIKKAKRDMQDKDFDWLRNLSKEDYAYLTDLKDAQKIVCLIHDIVKKAVTKRK